MKIAFRWCLCLLALIPVQTHAWFIEGHYRATSLAIAAAVGRVPSFLVKDSSIVILASGDPDLVRDKTVPQVKNQEGPEHYLDQELLDSASLPPLRYEYISLLCKKGIDPSRVGMLPYALAEWTQRLAWAFARQRQLPLEPGTQQTCEVYAGILAHYAADCCQPLHVTIHFDGRAGANGASPQTGIHEKVDGLLAKIPITAADKPTLPAALDCADIMQCISRQIKASHDLVDTVYSLEPQLPGLTDSITDPRVKGFAHVRLRASAAFIATLYITAGELSTKLKLPEWYLVKGLHDRGRKSEVGGRKAK